MGAQTFSIDLAAVLPAGMSRCNEMRLQFILMNSVD
jgi:hypothetical protein